MHFYKNLKLSLKCIKGTDPVWGHPRSGMGIHTPIPDHIQSDIFKWPSRE